jgi:hypothetical protein
LKTRSYRSNNFLTLVSIGPSKRGLPELHKLRKFLAGRQLIGPMILPGFMMLSGSSAFLIERISDMASPCSS